MKKTNNKGFSLVELIVVIAIMAVLVVVVAPQYTKYVERGRKSTDVQTVAAIVTACDIYQADTGKLKAGDSISLTGGSIVDVSTLTNGSVKDALVSAGITTCGLKSSEWTSPSGGSITFKVDTVTDGVPKYVVTGQNANLNILTGDIDATAAPAPTEP